MVGGKHSSNTKVLFQVCRENNHRSYWIEKLEELDYSWFCELDVVGITGSASTPNWLLERIKKQIELHFQKTLV